MFSKLLVLALAIFVLLNVNIASAGRLSDISQRRGVGPHFRRDVLEPREEDSLDSRPGKNRFLSKATRKYKVDHLPDIPFDIGEMYAGLIPIDMKNESRALYFVFEPTIGAPVDEITIWLNGGPGVFSKFRLVVNLTNMLWVEYPVGTGFSIDEVDSLNFFLNFEKIFGIKRFKIFVTGESYAGRYVPYISAAMLDKKDPDSFNLSGALMYDPVIGEYITTQEQVPTVPFVKENNNVLGLNDSFVAQLEELDVSCGYADFRKKYFTFPPSGVQPPKFFNSTTDKHCDVFNLAFDAAYAPNPCFNAYMLGTQCPILSDPLGYPTNLQYSYDGMPVYFNRSDVKRAMHAPKNIEWLSCKGPVFLGDGGPQGEGDLSPDPIQHVLPRIIEATKHVLVSNGDLDSVILTDGTLLAIQNMTWGGKLGFQVKPSTPIVITLPDLQYSAVFEGNGYGGLDGAAAMGIQHYERGLMWAQTYLSGHMQPQFQPRSSYRHLQWMLGHIDGL